MKYVWLISSYVLPLCFIAYYACKHLFRQGPVTVTHNEMFWLCMAAGYAILAAGDVFIKANFK